jgi:cell division protein FtsZ
VQQAPEPVPAWTPPVAEAAPEPEALDLTLDLSEEHAAPVPPTSAAGNDELVLGGSEEIGAPRVSVARHPTPRPNAPPARGAGWRWQHAVRTHGQSARSGKAADDEDDGGALNIPRFLGRQNNQ